MQNLIAILAVAYALAAAVACGMATGNAPVALRHFPEWAALPSELAALLAALLASLRWRRERSLGTARYTWPLVCAFAAMGMAAALVWNLWRPRGMGPVFSRADTLYLVDYAVLLLANASIFLRLGGSFRSRRIRLEALSMFAALLVTMWTITLGPLGPPVARQIPWYFAGSYAVTIAAMVTVAALAGLCLSSLRRQAWLALLLASGLFAATWELGWLGSWLGNNEFLGNYYSYGDVLCYTGICVAAALAPSPAAAFNEPVAAEQRIYAFFPTLTILVAIALVTGLLAVSPRGSDWIFACLVAICAVLLLGRQRIARADLARANSELALREADARVTELVRQSHDLLVIVADDGTVTFASPAAAAYTGRLARMLVGSPAVGLFGPRHAAAMAGLLAEARSAPTATSSVELRVGEPDSARTLNVAATNRLANPHISGLALTVSDITAERTLERELLEVATRERMSLAADLHDGLGQSLTGIALLLAAELNDRRAGVAPSAERIDSIIGVAREAIASVRELTRGAAPLYSVGGSLGRALVQIAAMVPGDPPVHVEIGAGFDDSTLGEATADHLYRIALEALRNARRHSRCRSLRLALCMEAGALHLSVADDGIGFDPARTPPSSFGLRLIAHRARVIGASLAVLGRPGQGTRIELRLPLGPGHGAGATGSAGATAALATGDG